MYGKIFASVFEGSMRGQSDVLLVWFNMLAHAPGGICDRTPQTISDETGLPLERVRAAITILESPDPMSRSPDEEGRRIVRLDDHRDWGWRLVNWEYYRQLMSESDRREKQAAKKRRQRQRPKHQHRPRSVPPEGGQGGTKWDNRGQPGTERGRGGTPASASASVQKGGVGENQTPGSGNKPPFTDYVARLNRLFGRDGSPWSYSEETEFAQLVKRPNFEFELLIMERYRVISTDEDVRYNRFPSCLARAFEQWTSYLDKARLAGVKALQKPARDPNVFYYGSAKFARENPPQRDQFTDERSFNACRQLFEDWCKRNGGKS